MQELERPDTTLAGALHAEKLQIEPARVLLQRHEELKTYERELNTNDLLGASLPVLDQRPSTVEFQDLERSLTEQAQPPQEKETEITAFRAVPGARRARNSRKGRLGRNVGGLEPSASELSGGDVPTFQAAELLSPTVPRHNDKS